MFIYAIFVACLLGGQQVASFDSPGGYAAALSDLSYQLSNNLDEQKGPADARKMIENSVNFLFRSSGGSEYAYVRMHDGLFHLIEDKTLSCSQLELARFQEVYDLVSGSKYLWKLLDAVKTYISIHLSNCATTYVNEKDMPKGVVKFIQILAEQSSSCAGIDTITRQTDQNWPFTCILASPNEPEKQTFALKQTLADYIKNDLETSGAANKEINLENFKLAFADIKQKCEIFLSGNKISSSSRILGPTIMNRLPEAVSGLYRKMTAVAQKCESLAKMDPFAIVSFSF